MREALRSLKKDNSWNSCQDCNKTSLIWAGTRKTLGEGRNQKYKEESDKQRKGILWSSGPIESKYQTWGCLLWDSLKMALSLAHLKIHLTIPAPHCHNTACPVITPPNLQRLANYFPPVTLSCQWKVPTNMKTTQVYCDFRQDKKSEDVVYRLGQNCKDDLNTRIVHHEHLHLACLCLWWPYALR